MAETYRAPKSVALELGIDVAKVFTLGDVAELRASTFTTTRAWADSICNKVAERAAALASEEIMTPEPTEVAPVFGVDTDIIPDGIMAADAAMDAAQTLLETFEDSNPVVSQAYYLIKAADAALDTVIEALGLNDPDEEISEGESATGDAADMQDRASHARLGEGTFVSWPSGSDRAKGKIEKVVTKGQATSSAGFSIEGTPDNPAYVIRVYDAKGNGFIAGDTTVVQRNDILTVTGALPAPRSAEEPAMIEERKNAIASAERITMDAEIRAMETDDGSLKVSGYAATFNREATGLNFREVIAPGAFARSIASDQPVFLLVNHDTDGIPLASTQSGTMTLTEDNIGLRMDASLDPANPKAQEFYSALKRGDMNKMSFSFTVAPGGDTRSEGLRTLTDLDLFEVSGVTWPAYDSTSITARSAQDESLALRKRALELKLSQISLRSHRKA